MAGQIWFIEILKSKLQHEFQSKKEKVGETFSSITITIKGGERKRVFILSQEEIISLFKDKNHKKSFKMFTCLDSNEFPVRVRADFFENVFLNGSR